MATTTERKQTQVTTTLEGVAQGDLVRIGKQGLVGTVIAVVDGFTIVFVRALAKTPRGRDRVWFQIRQAGTVKRWRQEQQLQYPHGLDVGFVRARGERG